MFTLLKANPADIMVVQDKYAKWPVSILDHGTCLLSSHYGITGILLGDFDLIVASLSLRSAHRFILINNSAKYFQFSTIVEKVQIIQEISHIKS